MNVLLRRQEESKHHEKVSSVDDTGTQGDMGVGANWQLPTQFTLRIARVNTRLGCTMYVQQNPQISAIHS